MKRSLAIDTTTSLLVLLFSYTAISKLISIDSFELVLSKSVLIGRGANLVARAVPLTEVAIVLLLIFPATKRIGLYASLILLTLFTLYLIYMLIYAPTLPCSCGGIIKSMSWPAHLVFNMGFIVITAVSLYLDRKTCLPANQAFVRA
jgi:hypothetical protein